MLPFVQTVSLDFPVAGRQFGWRGDDIDVGEQGLPPNTTYVISTGCHQAVSNGTPGWTIWTDEEQFNNISQIKNDQ